MIDSDPVLIVNIIFIKKANIRFFLKPEKLI